MSSREFSLQGQYAMLPREFTIYPYIDVCTFCVYDGDFVADIFFESFDCNSSQFSLIMLGLRAVFMESFVVQSCLENDFLFYWHSRVGKHLRKFLQNKSVSGQASLEYSLYIPLLDLLPIKFCQIDCKKVCHYSIYYLH